MDTCMDSTVREDLGAYANELLNGGFRLHQVRLGRLGMRTSCWVRARSSTAFNSLSAMLVIPSLNPLAWKIRRDLSPPTFLDRLSPEYQLFQGCGRP